MSQRSRCAHAGIAAVSAAVAFAVAGPARAGNASVSGLVDLRYQSDLGGDGALENALTAGLRARALPGRRLTTCLGLDARGGAGAGGALYAAEVYPIGIGLRHGRTSQIGLCAGVGLAGASGGAVPFAWTFPLELHWEGTGAFAIVRPLLVARASRTAGAVAREDGSELLPIADELHLAAGLRVFLPQEPLPGLATGDGVFLGITYDEALGARILGVAIGYGFAAGS